MTPKHQVHAVKAAEVTHVTQVEVSVSLTNTHLPGSTSVHAKYEAVPRELWCLSVVGNVWLDKVLVVPRFS